VRIPRNSIPPGIGFYKNNNKKKLFQKFCIFSKNAKSCLYRDHYASIPRQRPQNT
jgi:hypothetical protein